MSVFSFALILGMVCGGALLALTFVIIEILNRRIARKWNPPTLIMAAFYLTAWLPFCLVPLALTIGFLDVLRKFYGTESGEINMIGGYVLTIMVGLLGICGALCGWIFSTLNYRVVKKSS
jgi:hypothetical protein